MANKRIKKKHRIDGSFVKEIADMQRTIDDYERMFWGLADYARNGNNFIPDILDRGSLTGFAVETIFCAIKKYREELCKEEKNQER